jgi:hypothetical protein
MACLWARVVGPEAGAVAEVLPDACVDLIWEQGHGLFVAGPDTGPAPSATPAGTVLAGVRFVPGAAGPALGLPMSELLNLRVDAADLGTGPAGELARALPGSLAPARALRVLARMTGAMSAEGPADPLAARAARMLRHPGARAEGVADRLDVSDRQLRRRCRAAVGYGPATLRRGARQRPGHHRRRTGLRRPGAPHQGVHPPGRPDPGRPARRPAAHRGDDSGGTRPSD